MDSKSKIEKLDWGKELSVWMILFHEAIASKLKIHTTDLKCLSIINRTENITAGEIAKHTGLTTGSVTALINRLEKRGFVTRIKDPDDNRKVIIKANQSKQKEIRNLYKSFNSAITNLYSQYSQKELLLIGKFLAESVVVLKSETDKLTKVKNIKKRKAKEFII